MACLFLGGLYNYHSNNTAIRTTPVIINMASRGMGQNYHLCTIMEPVGPREKYRTNTGCKAVYLGMNARSYRVDTSVSPLDFPAIRGLGESSITWRSEVPQIINKKVVLTISKQYIHTDMSTNKKYEVLSVQSKYEIPIYKINSRGDVYEFYKDAMLNLNEAYQLTRTQLPTLHNITFPTQPIENYRAEIDRVFNLLYSRN